MAALWWTLVCVARRELVLRVTRLVPLLQLNPTPLARGAPGTGAEAMSQARAVEVHDQAGLGHVLGLVASHEGVI